MPKLLLKTAKKAYVSELGRDVSVAKQRLYYVKDISKDFHTEYGVVKATELRKDGQVHSTSGKEFYCFPATFVDDYLQLERSAQIITLKDIGFILSECGLGNDSIVIDAGTGSGALACYLAHVCRKVVSYELREDFHAIAKRNKESLGLKNLELKRADVAQLSEREVDAVILDLPEPDTALAVAAAALRMGGHLVVYNPNLTQITAVMKAIPEWILHVKTVELIERQWTVDAKRCRPSSGAIGHTGFIMLMRKMGGG